MIIEILNTNNAHIPTPRTFPARGERPARTVYEQQAYAHLGGVFPVMFKITHEDHNAAYPVGKYKISDSSFKINQYDQLELDRFNFRLVPLNESDLKKAG